MSIAYESVFIRTNGIQLHTVQIGPADGKPVFFLHGFPETWRAWKHQIEPCVQAGLRVIAPDQRGYHLSAKPKGLNAYRLDELARDVTGLMDALEIQQAPVVGHDWGGIVAWALAALHPERIERLAILNAPYPSILFRSVWRAPTQPLRSLYALFFQTPYLPEALLRNKNWELLVQGLMKSSRPGAFSEQDLQHYRQAWWEKDAMTSMLNWYRAALQRPVRLPAQARITAPTLILWGKKDFALSPVLAKLSLEVCESGLLLYRDDATHWLQHEEPEWVNQHLLQFLT